MHHATFPSLHVRNISFLNIQRGVQKLSLHPTYIYTENTCLVQSKNLQRLKQAIRALQGGSELVIREVYHRCEVHALVTSHARCATSRQGRKKKRRNKDGKCILTRSNLSTSVARDAQPTGDGIEYRPGEKRKPRESQ